MNDEDNGRYYYYTPVIRTNNGIGVLRPIIKDSKDKYIRICVREDKKKHRCFYSIGNEIFFETSKGKSDDILNFIKDLQNKLSKDLNR